MNKAIANNQAPAISQDGNNKRLYQYYQAKSAFLRRYSSHGRQDNGDPVRSVYVKRMGLYCSQDKGRDGCRESGWDCSWKAKRFTSGQYVSQG